MGWPRPPEWVDANFTQGGWHPGRDIGEDGLAALVAPVLAAYREDGRYDLELFPAAADFLREHGGVAMRLGDRPRDRLLFDPDLPSRDEPEEAAELARGLGLRVFPIGYDLDEGARFYIDETGRFFYEFWEELHYVGAEKYEAFGGPLFGGPFAEDFYAVPPR
ncbi:SUKH-3 domain-containing protein [Streptomyces sp. NBC_01351]|uniref:SUKH-3 domain-containing protein n=1 Tax=Streptomyces sp. NBC_01351 TaxID=2903833 RepID=UPI002E34919D|nr:SUKH-3 domain-containing protein [Streptomyces sp. NBC_01351]